MSLTNWAESVSRNIDRLTLDQQEQLITEAERQVELQGFSDGLVHGISGFGIRILGESIELFMHTAVPFVLYKIYISFLFFLNVRRRDRWFDPSSN